MGFLRIVHRTGRPEVLPNPRVLAFLLLCLLTLAFPAPPRADAQVPLPYMPRVQKLQAPPPIELPAPPEGSAQEGQTPLSASEAARIALGMRGVIKKAQADVAAARGRTQQAQSPLNPTVTVGTGYTGINNFISPSSSTGTGIIAAPAGGVAGSTGQTVSIPGYQVNAAVRQLIYDFNHTRQLIREAQAQEEALGATLTKTQQQVVLEVKTTFYDHLYKARLVTIYEKTLSTQKEHLSMAEERFKAGVGLPQDVVRSEAAVASTIYQLTQARNDASISRIKLATLMGVDPRTPLLTSDDPEPPPAALPLEAFIEKALRERPDMKGGMSQVKAAEYALGAAATNNAPDVVGSTSYSMRGYNFPPHNSDQLSTTLSIQWSIGDGGLTPGMVKEAKAHIEAARAQLEETKQAVISEVSQAYLSMASAEQKLTASDAEVANADESLRLAEGRFKSGLGILLDVLDAQNALLTARVNRVKARLDVDLSIASLAYALGENLPPPRQGP
ncbi:MAG: TolC family protein [Candidatus Eremiobacteraeota bacterium]|nr:TolC family protein [Candidatus Eremiobacteraeota bacterium]